MPEHIAALIALIATFVVKWSVKWVLLKLHGKGKINTLVTVLACMLVFMVTYTFFHVATPSAEAVILIGILVLEITRIEE